MNKKLVYPLLIFTLLSVTMVQILTRSVNPFGLFFWIISIGIVIRLNWNKKEQIALFNIEKKDYIILAVFVVIQTSILILLNLNSGHYHRDEFIVAYTSYQLPSVTKINWFEGFPKTWVAQFPILFYILQKPFLIFLGPSIFSVRISLLPYNIFILFYVYLFAKHLVHRKFAALTSLLYIFLACNLYMTSLGVHIIASMFCVIATLYHFSFIHEKSNQNHSILVGIFMAMSFLNYIGSYITLPIIFISSLFLLWKNRPSHMIKKIQIISIIFTVILLPFIIHNIFVYPYFFERYNTVNFLHGERSTYQEELMHGIPALAPIIAQISNSFFALSTPNIGGTDGYYFGNQALFDPVTYVLFIIGIWSLLYFFLKNKSPTYLVILITISLGYILGYVLTIQPPAFHRLSVLFPLFSLVISLGLYVLISMYAIKNKLISNLLFILGVSLYLMMNVNHLRLIFSSDYQEYPYGSRLTEKIQETIPSNSEIFIAGDPGYYMKEEMFFRTQNRYIFTNIDKDSLFSDYHDQPILLISPTEEETDYIKQILPTFTFEYLDYGNDVVIGLFYPQSINNESAIINE